MKVNYFWARGMSSIKEQGNLWWTLTHQVTQSGIQELVFSRVEIWWIDGSKNSLWTTTRFLQRAHEQIYCWLRWYGLWRRRRIRRVVDIQIISALGEWSSAKGSKSILKKCNTRQWQTFFNMENVYVFDIGSMCIHGKELPGNFTFHQKYMKRVSQWNRSSTYLQSW